MNVTAPPVIDRYLTAAAEREFAVLAECFAADGTVTDEGRTYRGRTEIIGWREALASAFTYTSTITESEPLGEDAYRIAAHLEGDFPGGVADLTYRFTLRDDLIADLTIA
jgi:hypothetical protein